MSEATVTTATTTSSSRGPESSVDSHGNTKDIDWMALGIELTLRVAIAMTSGYLLMKLTRQMLQADAGGPDGDTPAEKTIHKRLRRILLKRSGGDLTSVIELPKLSAYERQMAEEILDPEEIESTFADIGGLDETKREIYELAVLPLVQPELFTGKLVQPCKGILLFGKPGTGKTMMAKALAKEAKAVFLPLQLSRILSKWVGESNKLIAATFSLAHKLQPAIIFIDELDTFLKANDTADSAAYLDAIKAEFLTLWDGVSTAGNSRVLVLGATNKPHTIDSAILRRMPRAFQVPLPNAEGRLAILNIILKDERLEESAREYLPEMAKNTVGYSGSDLKEVCKSAAMVPVQEVTAEFARQRVMGKAVSELPRIRSNTVIRPISKTDLVIGMTKVRRTGAVAKSYGRDEAAERQSEEVQNNATIDARSLQQLASLLRTLTTAVPIEETKDDGDEIPVIR